MGVESADGGVEGVEVAAAGSGTAEAAAELTPWEKAQVPERAWLRERAYELGLRPAGQLSTRALRKLVAANDHVELTAEARAGLLDYVTANPDCSLAEACRTVRVKRSDVRAQLKADQDFYDDYQTARGRGLEDVYEAVDRLALKGVKKPLVSAGKLVTDANGDVVEVTEYSEKLAELLYRSRTPEGRAMEQRKLGIEISGADGGPVVVQAGVALGDVFAFMREHVAAGQLDPGSVGELEAGEIVAESDEPIG